MPWYHGGIPGLEPGDLILPPRESGASMAAKYGEAGERAEHGRVYVSRDPRHAATYAASYPLGDVYEVERLGTTGRDHDLFIAGFSSWCERARVVRVTRRAVRLLPSGRLSR